MIRPKYLSLIMAAALIAAGCNNAANTAANNTASASANANSASPTPAADAVASEPGNAAGSPTEVYKAAYTARQNCDVPGLKKIMAKDILQFLTDMAKADKKTLDDQLKEICTHPQAKTQQVRNEKIDGDHASLEYLDEEGEWQQMFFVREGGAWKMSMGKPDADFPVDDAPKNINSKDDNRS